jgi:hypothetical protein
MAVSLVKSSKRTEEHTEALRRARRAYLIQQRNPFRYGGS